MNKKILSLFVLGLCTPLAWANVAIPDIEPVSEGQHVVINIPQLRLFLFENGQLRNIYPIAVGKSRTQTPMGEYQIGNKAFNPTWHVPLSIQREMAASGKPVLTAVPSGPKNPLGPVFVRFGDPKLGLGIHGTNVPSSVPGVRSHGCVRMKSPDALKFAKSVQTGSQVSVIYQLAALNEDEAGDLWLAAYPDPYQENNLNRKELTKHVAQWADSNKPVNAALLAQTLKARSSKLVCLSCTPGKKTIAGSLVALRWQDGSMVAIRNSTEPSKSAIHATTAPVQSVRPSMIPVQIKQELSPISATRHGALEPSAAAVSNAVELTPQSSTLTPAGKETVDLLW